VTLFLWGASAMASTIAALFFLRYWWTTRDRLLLFFALAFLTLATNWTTLAIVQPATESKHLVYAIRLVAFALILAGIVDKNRRAAAP
jgi:hypothetical protein